MHTIKPKELKALIANQETLKSVHPQTTRATFKLSLLKEFIEHIERLPGYKQDDSFTHNICITFVREDLAKPALYPVDTNKQLDQSGYYHPNSGKKYSQLVPVITGCEYNYDVGFHPQGFSYLRDQSGEIPYLRPGGEASGLIPPPPAPDDDLN